MKVRTINGVYEKQCARCLEFWPAYEEFFYRLSDGRLHSYCRACFLERAKELKEGAERKFVKGPKIERIPWFLKVETY